MNRAAERRREFRAAQDRWRSRCLPARPGWPHASVAVAAAAPGYRRPHRLPGGRKRRVSWPAGRCEDGDGHHQKRRDARCNRHRDRETDDLRNSARRPDRSRSTDGASTRAMSRASCTARATALVNISTSLAACRFAHWLKDEPSVGHRGRQPSFWHERRCSAARRSCVPQLARRIIFRIVGRTCPSCFGSLILNTRPHEAIDEPRGRTPIAPYVTIPETPHGRTRSLRLRPATRTRSRDHPAASAADIRRLFWSAARHVAARQSRVAGNTTTRRREVDERWINFNQQLIINLRG